jgi:anti-sigma regulatory factor (Ser/Thr protein kinase)
MACVNKTLKGMLAEVGNARKIKSEEIVPFSYYGDNPGEIFQEHGEFYWLRQYEASLTRFLETLKLPINLRFIPETTSPVQSALENAYVHATGDGGKTGNMKSPINVDVFLGDEGIVFVVTDTGKGFDLMEVVRNKRNGKKYFNACRGNGILVYDQQIDAQGRVPYQVSGEGNRINVMYKFQPEQSPLSQ